MCDVVFGVVCDGVVVIGLCFFYVIVVEGYFCFGELFFGVVVVNLGYQICCVVCIDQVWVVGDVFWWFVKFSEEFFVGVGYFDDVLDF